MSKETKREYRLEVLSTLLRLGPLSKYKMSKETGIPYPTVLRLVPALTKAGLMARVGIEKRGAEIYVATPTGALLSYFSGRIKSAELFQATPIILAHMKTPIGDISAAKDPLRFVEELPFRLAQLEHMRPEEAVSLLGALLISKHEEWYREVINKGGLKGVFPSERDRSSLKQAVAASIETLTKMEEQIKHLRKLAHRFLSEI